MVDVPALGDEREITVSLTQDEIWNAFVLCENKSDAYHPDIRKRMRALGKKLNELGREHFNWT